jgi:aspartyl-tRNA(Asn)/glutamyl-tRNA(Gln) amidotransferase subunit C
MSLSIEEVRHLADLARISLSVDELEIFQHQLAEVIGYNIGVLQELDVQNVLPTLQTTGLQNMWRNDQVIPSLSQSEALQEAPRKQDGQFVVQKVMESSS